MKLELDKEDLQEKYIGDPALQVGFEHLNPIVQAAIKVVGKATFYQNNGIKNGCFNIIYPPKK